MSTLECVVCKKGPPQSVALFRINAKGQPGLWACRQHMNQTDGHIDPEVDQVVSAIEDTNHER